MSDPPPLVTHVYTADPSAHVFNGRLYFYPSHDIPTDTPANDSGDQYAMKDYHVFSTASLSSLPTKAPEVTDHGVVLSTKDVPWVGRQLWAPDAAARNGKYYLFFPARDKDGIFRIGVAVGDKPEGPFTPEKEAIKGSFSIDPAVFVDEEKDEAYIYFGGLWGGQLQCYTNDPSTGHGDASTFDASKQGPHEPTSGAALSAKVAKLSKDMLSFDGPITDAQILDPQTKQPISAEDHDRRFFEAAWMHKRNGVYYLSYSTGDSHFIAYATSDSPVGPFTYGGTLLEPVLGWTTHHSIVEFEGKWWLFYHDASLSKGQDHLRSVKAREVVYDAEGALHLKDPQPKLADAPPARLEG